MCLNAVYSNAAICESVYMLGVLFVLAIERDVVDGQSMVKCVWVSETQVMRIYVTIKYEY